MFNLPAWITGWLIFYWGCVAACWVVSLVKKSDKDEDEKGDKK